MWHLKTIWFTARITRASHSYLSWCPIVRVKTRSVGEHKYDISRLGWMGVIWRFSKIGVPPVIIHFSRIFPEKNQQFWGSPISGNPQAHIYVVFMGIFATFTSLVAPPKVVTRTLAPSRSMAPRWYCSPSHKCYHTLLHGYIWHSVCKSNKNCGVSKAILFPKQTHRSANSQNGYRRWSTDRPFFRRGCCPFLVERPLNSFLVAHPTNRVGGLSQLFLFEK